MSYMALYRKFRPTEFAEVKGQDHIVTTLLNQIRNDRIGHAYLFTGTRGTGKTTVAKILAKAVNCSDLRDGNPCNACDICNNINSGASVNVRELDAASNNGVDNIRQIIDEVAYPPTEGRYRVYIIDEVHMLSTGAFNALLKTLEEPPDYVIFILATTEVSKIPITILSRCQRYDFHRITNETIRDRLSELCVREGIKADDRAINYIAKVSDGSMRDALSLLDQCVAFFLGEELTYDNVLKCLGAVDTEIFSRLTRCIIDKNVTGCLDIVEHVLMSGKEIGQFVSDLTWYLRNIVLIKSSDDMADIIDVSSDNLLLIKEEANLISLDALMRYIRILSELSDKIRYASNKRILVEIALIKLCKDAIEPDVALIMERLETLEDRIESGVISATIPVNIDSTLSQSTSPLEDKVPPKALPEDIRQVVANWKNIVQAIDEMSVKTAFMRAKFNVTEDNGKLVILSDKNSEGNDEKYASKIFSDENTKENGVDVRAVLSSTIEKVIGKKVDIIVREDSNVNTGHTLDPRQDFKSPVAERLNFDMEEE